MYKVKITFNPGKAEAVEAEYVFDTIAEAEAHITLMRAHKNLDILREWSGETESYREDTASDWAGPAPTPDLD